MSEMYDFELSPKQVEKILVSQAHKAVSKAFREISLNKKSRIVIEATLKSELRRILRGEIIYKP